jgi:hypothetical protein
MYERVGPLGYPRRVHRAGGALGHPPAEGEEPHRHPHAGVRAGPARYQIPVVQHGLSGTTIAVLGLLGIAAAVPFGYFGWKWWKATEVPAPQEVESS